MKQALLAIPIVGPALRRVRRSLDPNRRNFPGSASYWDGRYHLGGNSGAGSYRELADFKAEVLNDFVSERGIEKVIEFGCGDGNQLSLASYSSYIGVDVSPNALKLCEKRFASDPSKTFVLTGEDANCSGELALSLDVIYHLVEDDVFNRYMDRLFEAASRHVIIYASNTDDQGSDNAPHVRHRKFTDWVERERSDWRLVGSLPNRYPYRGPNELGSFADFFFFEPTA